MAARITNRPAAPVYHDVSLLTADDLHLFNEGTHYRLAEKLGAHLIEREGAPGANFAVWAPNAETVSVIGDFNGWRAGEHRLMPRGGSGIWEGWIPKLGPGTIYKYHIRSRHDGYQIEKSDPYGFYHEPPPRTASRLWQLDYEWHDQEWMQRRGSANVHPAPISIYEVHLGSWARMPEEKNRPLTYRELAPRLASYIKDLGFTHVEFLPVMEHPFYGSWGYQTTGYFAPTSRYGSPQDFMQLVDVLHQHGIGVILDFVPSHFPTDAHGLSYFDGTHLYEHSDPRQGLHPDWNTYIFNYDRHEVRSFLLSSALFWLDRYHADGLRIDAVASMLYLDYSRPEGEWIPNEFGGRENLGAISFLRKMNEVVYREHPDTQTYAEESTAWPSVSRPTYLGGLGFGFKWDMGWMHDTLAFFEHDPVHRRYHHNQLTFRMLYAFTENYVLPLSHDEVVHGKGSLLGKMPGDDWQKFANLRLLLAYMYSQPGKKLLFMGAEMGQWEEWHHDSSLPWHLLQYDRHRGLQWLLRDLNRLYTTEPALHQLDTEPAGFSWVDANDADNSVLTFLRYGGRNEGATHPENDRRQMVLAACNFTPVPRLGYRVGVPERGWWRELLNTDAREYGGSGMGNAGGAAAGNEPRHGRPFSLTITLPPLSAVFFKLTP